MSRLAREIIDQIRESLGMQPDPWPSDKALDDGTSIVLQELSAFLSAPSAGDLYLSATDEWVEHAERCDSDDCDACVLLLNRLRLARKVWQNSQHKAVTA